MFWRLHDITNIVQCTTHTARTLPGREQKKRKRLPSIFLPSWASALLALTQSTHWFFLPTSSCCHEAGQTICRSLRFALSETGDLSYESEGPLSPPPHPIQKAAATGGKWGRRRGMPELFCQVTLLGGGHWAQARSLAAETVIQYLNPFLLQSVTLHARWTEPEWCWPAPEKLVQRAVSFRLGKNTRRGASDQVIWTVGAMEWQLRGPKGCLGNCTSSVLTVNLAIDPATPSECWRSQMLCKALWLRKGESDTRGAYSSERLVLFCPFGNSSESTSPRRQHGLGAVGAERREKSSQKHWLLGSQGVVGGRLHHLPFQGHGLSSAWHVTAAVPPQKELGSLSYCRPPAQAAACWDGANLAPPSARPRLACAAKDSRTQDTELLICEDSGCWRCWYNNQAVSSSAQASYWCAPVK